MKRLIFIFISVIIFNTALFAQNIDAVLAEVENNNTALSAIRERTDAEKIGNKTGIFLNNPEVEFNYLWGTPSAIGDRKDVSVSQSFDFPTVYKYRNQISDLKNRQAELQYIKQQKALMLETRLLLYDLIYVNALETELNKRLQHAQNIADAYKSQFEAGETNILEFNKAQLSLLQAKKQLEAAETERIALLSELKGLNGGIPVNFTESKFQPVAIPADFDKWYEQAQQQNPVLNWLKQEIEISEKQIKLNKAQSLPKFQTGYMSETVIGEQFQGITLGISIPLWENKNEVKYARANSNAVALETKNSKLQFYNRLKTLHSKAAGLQKSVLGYQSELASLDHSGLLRKALDAGEISLTDYILELSVFYESVNQLLELERDVHQITAELMQFM